MSASDVRINPIHELSKEQQFRWLIPSQTNLYKLFILSKG